MNRVVYSNQPKETLKNYLVCKRVSNKWQVVTSYKYYEVAEASKKIRAAHELTAGTVTDTLFYRIYYKENVEIKEL